MAIIEIKHLTKTFENGVTALRDVSLSVEEGEIFGIIGLSGAGKSTLVRCINLLERPTEGQVLLDGEELTALSPPAQPGAPPHRHDLPVIQSDDAAYRSVQRHVPPAGRRRRPEGRGAPRR